MIKRNESDVGDIGLRFIYSYNIAAKGRIALYIIHQTGTTKNNNNKNYTKMGREKESNNMEWQERNRRNK